MTGMTIILALSCAGLMISLLRITKQVREINEVLDDVQKGNLDRRIVIHKNTLLTDTCYKINEIVMETKEQRILSERGSIRNDKLMTCLSHDIRTPLTSIIGCLDAIHYQLIQGESSRASIETAREKAYLLKQYIDELFQWFKLHSKDEKANLKRIEIVEELRAVYAGWIETLENSHISYDFVTEKAFHQKIFHMYLSGCIRKRIPEAVLEADSVWRLPKSSFCCKTGKFPCSQLKIMERLFVLNCRKHRRNPDPKTAHPKRWAVLFLQGFFKVKVNMVCYNGTEQSYGVAKGCV